MNIEANEVLIKAGQQGDNLSTSILFNVENVISDHGSGTWTVTIQRASDTAGYPTSNFTVSDGVLTLKMTASDMAVEGVGRIQLKYTVDTVIAYSRVYEFLCKGSLSGGATPPDPWVSWVTQVTEAADRAEEAVEHYPYIDSTSKHWMSWDVDEEEWTDTNVVAEGSDAEVTASNIAAALGYTPLSDAPSDSKQYARKNGAWAEVTGGGGTSTPSITDLGTLIFSSSAPSVNSDGTLIFS